MNIYFNEITDKATTTFTIKYRENKNFRNMQFNNEDFKEVISKQGFISTGGGFGFYFEKEITKPMFFNKSFDEELNAIREYMESLATWLDEIVIDSAVDKIICPICGYDEFNPTRVAANGYSRLEDLETGHSLLIIFCKKCRAPLIMNR